MFVDLQHRMEATLATSIATNLQQTRDVVMHTITSAHGGSAPAFPSGIPGSAASSFKTWQWLNGKPRPFPEDWHFQSLVVDILYYKL